MASDRIAVAAPKLGEFERIARFFAPLAGTGALGLVDDVALIDVPPGRQLVLTTDAIIAGIDYLPDDPPDLVARKLLRVAQDQAEFAIALLGGDSSATPGPTTLSLAALGTVVAGQAILRRGAEPGDLIYVSGTIGDAALGLRALRGELAGLAAAERDFLADRYHLPRPRLALGQHLVGIAHAMLDVSDGLVGDLNHLAVVSGVAAVIEAALVPLSPAARAALARDEGLLSLVLGGGDDYELVFAVPPDAAAAIAALASALALPITMIGRVTTGSGVEVVDGTGRRIELGASGYRHF